MAEKNTKGDESILSDSTYNMLSILLSKLEGLDIYDTYLEDMEGDGREIIQQIRRDDERHAQMLREHVEKVVQKGGLR